MIEVFLIYHKFFRQIFFSCSMKIDFQGYPIQIFALFRQDPDPILRIHISGFRAAAASINANSRANAWKRSNKYLQRSLKAYQPLTLYYSENILMTSSPISVKLTNVEASQSGLRIRFQMDRVWMQFCSTKPGSDLKNVRFYLTIFIQTVLKNVVIFFNQYQRFRIRVFTTKEYPYPKYLFQKIMYDQEILYDFGIQCSCFL